MRWKVKKLLLIFPYFYVGDNIYHMTDDNQTQLRQYPYRYVIGGLFAGIAFVNGMCWVVVTPISVQIQKAYDVSPALVSLIPMSYMLLYIVVNFPSNWVLDVKGIKKGMFVGATLTFLGTGIRAMVKFDFAFLVVGQVLCAIGQPFILNAPMKIATRWFKKQNRSLALALLIVTNIIGSGIGFLIPSIFVTGDSASDNSTVKDQFLTLLLFEFILAGVSSILIYIFFRESPPTLPSLGAQVEIEAFGESIRKLLQNKTFLALAFAYGTVNGSFNIYGSLLDDILDPYGYTDDQVSMLGLGMMIAGIISAALVGIYVERTLKYKRAFVMCSILGLLTTVAFPLCLQEFYQSYWLFMLIVLMQGIVFIPLQPLSSDYACDFMFPVGEAQISGFLMTAGQIMGVVFVVLSQNVFGLGNGGSVEDEKASALHSVIMSNSLLAIGCVIMMLQKAELKRAKLQQNQGGSLISGNSLAS